MRIIVIFFLLIYTNIFAQQQIDDLVFDMDSSQEVVFYQWKYQIGDNPQYAKTDYEDSIWPAIGKEFIQKKIDQIWWYRKTIYLKGNQHEFDFLSLLIVNPATAYEVYWDGELIHKEGTVATSKSIEIPGSIKRLIKLKSELTTSGKHLVAMRLSNFHRIKPRYKTSIQYLMKYNNKLNRILYRDLFDIGMFLFATIFSLGLFLSGGRHRPYLIFTGFSLLNMLYSFIRYLESTIDISSIFFDYIYEFYIIGTPLSYFIFNLFFILNFNTKHKIFHLAVNILIALVLLIVYPFTYMPFFLCYSMGILLYAVINKETGSIIALFGVTAYTIFSILYFLHIITSFLFADIILIFSIIFTISRQIRTQNKLYEISKIRSARLETELLKKNIRPHFLMNTLLSIISWIEMNPKKSMKLIQALADEFRMIDDISSKKKIPIYEEIKLCKTHLDLMCYRMDAKYKLETHNLCEDEYVPPMIFHTLIENGLTHAYQTGENGLFTLTCEKNVNHIHYSLINGGSLLKKISYALENKINEGMGLKYIKARLNESYPNRWKLTYGLIEDEWVTDIYIEN